MEGYRDLVPDTRSSQHHFYDPFSTVQSYSVGRLRRTVSNCPPEYRNRVGNRNNSDYHDTVDHRDHISCIEKNRLSLNGGRGYLNEASGGNSTGLTTEFSLRNGEAYSMKRVGQPQSSAMETPPVDKQRDSLPPDIQGGGCMKSPMFSMSSFQSVDNSFTHFRNQRQVLNTESEIHARAMIEEGAVSANGGELPKSQQNPLNGQPDAAYPPQKVAKTEPATITLNSAVEEQAKILRDSAESALAGLLEYLKVGTQNREPAHFGAYLPTKAEALPGHREDSLSSYLLAPLSNEQILSASHDAQECTGVQLEPFCTDISSQQSHLISEKKQRIDEWRRLEKLAKRKPKGSKEWTVIWKKIYAFCKTCSETDHHFNLNMAIALTRLKQFDKAKNILYEQLSKSHSDKAFISGINKQLGFIFYYEENYVESIKYYMNGVSSHTTIAFATYNYISISMQHMLKESDDELFKENANQWFMGLYPKVKKTEELEYLEEQNVMFPQAHSYPSFPMISENYLKWSEPVQNEGLLVNAQKEFSPIPSSHLQLTKPVKKTPGTEVFPVNNEQFRLLDRWNELKSTATNEKPGSSQWNKSWGRAKDFALQCATVNYHYNLNAAIALTRLNYLDQALEILLSQLTMPETKKDEKYLAGVNKQLGFIYYRKEKHADSIHHYRQCFDGSIALPDKIYQYITTSVKAMEKGVYSEPRSSALSWYKRLFPRSVESDRKYHCNRIVVASPEFRNTSMGASMSNKWPTILTSPKNPSFKR